MFLKSSCPAANAVPQGLMATQDKRSADLDPRCRLHRCQTEESTKTQEGAVGRPGENILDSGVMARDPAAGVELTASASGCVPGWKTPREGRTARSEPLLLVPAPCSAPFLHPCRDVSLRLLPSLPPPRRPRSHAHAQCQTRDVSSLVLPSPTLRCGHSHPPPENSPPWSSLARSRARSRARSPAQRNPAVSPFHSTLLQEHLPRRLKPFQNPVARLTCVKIGLELLGALRVLRSRPTAPEVEQRAWPRSSSGSASSPSALWPPPWGPPLWAPSRALHLPVGPASVLREPPGGCSWPAGSGDASF